MTCIPTNIDWHKLALAFARGNIDLELEDESLLKDLATGANSNPKWNECIAMWDKAQAELNEECLYELLSNYDYDANPALGGGKQDIANEIMMQIYRRRNLASNTSISTEMERMIEGIMGETGNDVANRNDTHADQLKNLRYSRNIESDENLELKVASWRIRNQTPQGCCVYLIQGAGLHKIGVTDNLKMRFKDLNCASPVNLYVSKVIVCPAGRRTMFKLEKFLHRVFASKRVKGEWFRLDRKDIKRIERSCRHWIVDFGTDLEDSTEAA